MVGSGHQAVFAVVVGVNDSLAFAEVAARDRVDDVFTGDGRDPTLPSCIANSH